MKITSPIDASVVEDSPIAQTPMKVCMHVLRTARTDYRAMRTATALIKEGFAVSIVDVECERTIPIKENIGGIWLKHMIIPNWFTSRRFQPWFFFIAIRTFILSLLWMIQTQADIYHAAEVTALPACYIAAQFCRKPLIFEAYELPPPETSIGFWRRLENLLTRFLTLILPRCAGVITASPFYAQEIRKRFHVAEVSVVRSMPEYRSVQKSDRLRQYLGLNPDTLIALYQGNLQPNRELDKLIYAAACLEHNIVIVLMGKGMGTTQKQLEAVIASEGVADRVKIIPPVPYEELLDWTASADIGLTIFSPNYSLSIRYTLPNKLFEYLMAGLPVLTSELDAVLEVLKIYDVGQVVSSLTPEDIGKAINTMLADRSVLDRMRHNALRAAQDCCWEKESQQLIRLYHNILTTQREANNSLTY